MIFKKNRFYIESMHFYVGLKIVQVKNVRLVSFEKVIYLHSESENRLVTLLFYTYF